MPSNPPGTLAPESSVNPAAPQATGAPAARPETPAAADLSGDPQAPESQNGSGLAAVGGFLRTDWWRAIGLSALALVPCFWHRLIEAGDLGSHVYNAWLAQLIDHGQAPGLWLAHPSSNVLFDLMLSGAGSVVGLAAAQKIVVSAAVLIFFWGAFAFVSAVARRKAWTTIPCLLMFAYGWTFQQGLMNYYLSIGLALLGLALVLRGRGFERLAVLALVPFIWMAHPLGVALLIGLGAYLLLAPGLKWQKQLLLFGAAAGSLGFAGLYAEGHYEVFWPPAQLSEHLFYNGADQLVLYGQRYHLVSVFFLLLLMACIAAELIKGRDRARLVAKYALPAQLYSLALLAALLLPDGIRLRQTAAPALLLTDRFTSVTAIIACCLLATSKPRRWHLASFAALAVVFFSFLYGDTATLNRMEVQAGRYERVLPPGQHMVATIWPFHGSRIFINHIVDRACVGYCFSYGNYEPSSQQFRVRAHAGNRFVVASAADADAIEGGQYIVKKTDPTLFQIYQCNLNLTTLCMRQLVPGERNGDVGVQMRKPPDQRSTASPQHPALPPAR